MASSETVLLISRNHLTRLRSLLSQDLPCFSVRMLRADAEAAYGELMYDKFEVPAAVTELTLVYIPGVTLHASPNTCAPSTGIISAIQVKWNGISCCANMSYPRQQAWRGR